MPILLRSDRQHPLAYDEGMAIARAGSYEHMNAIGKLSRPFDRLFDGPDPDSPWVGAGLRVEDFCGHVPGTKNPQIFAEPFFHWGPGDEGVMAAFCVTDSGRPVLMSLVPFKGPRPTDAVNEYVAKKRAVQNARDRSADL